MSQTTPTNTTYSDVNHRGFIVVTDYGIEPLVTLKKDGVLVPPEELDVVSMPTSYLKSGEDYPGVTQFERENIASSGHKIIKYAEGEVAYLIQLRNVKWSYYTRMASNEIKEKGHVPPHVTSVVFQGDECNDPRFISMLNSSNENLTEYRVVHSRRGEFKLPGLDFSKVRSLEMDPGIKDYSMLSGVSLDKLSVNGKHINGKPLDKTYVKSKIRKLTCSLESIPYLRKVVDFESIEKLRVSCTNVPLKYTSKDLTSLIEGPQDVRLPATMIERLETLPSNVTSMTPFCTTSIDTRGLKVVSKGTLHDGSLVNHRFVGIYLRRTKHKNDEVSCFECLRLSTHTQKIDRFKAKYTELSGDRSHTIGVYHVTLDFKRVRSKVKGAHSSAS
uniref:Uncharacterized protein n=1 Tax=viral metagenome TaxID=1070528 RepID=A0A6C0JTD0_9ZZZZ